MIYTTHEKYETKRTNASFYSLHYVTVTDIHIGSSFIDDPFYCRNFKAFAMYFTCR